MNRRQRAYRAGRRAEALARWLLRLKGYRIVGQGFRTAVGEIDIVARRGRVMAFVEVKRRRTLAQGLASLSARQRRRVARAAEAFRNAHPQFQDLDVRFDLIVIMPRRLPHHIMDAWR